MRLTYLASLSLIAVGLCAAEPAAPSRRDVRLLVGVTPNYQVTEAMTPAGGGSGADFKWQGSDRMAPALGLQWLFEFGQPRQTGRPIIGAEVLLSTGVVQPETYGSNGATQVNADSETFSYVAAHPALVLGWRFTQPEGSSIGVIGEVQAALGVTALTGELKNAYGSDLSIGYGADAGIRLLLGLQEAGWLGTVSVGAHRGVAGITMDMDTYTSDLTLDSIGAEVLVSIGYLF